VDDAPASSSLPRLRELALGIALYAVSAGIEARFTRRAFRGQDAPRVLPEYHRSRAISDLDFTRAGPLAAATAEALRPAVGPVYNAAVAMDFFRGAGKLEEVAAGTVLFAKDERTSGLFSRGDRMYLVLEGEVSLARDEQVIGRAKAGEIFGKMAALTHAPRSASAIARTDCRLLALDGRQFEARLRQKPEFARMLLAILIQRIRHAAAALARRGALAAGDLTKPTTVFDNTLMTGLRKLMREREPVRYSAGQTIFKEGDTGAFLYIVNSGTVAIVLQGKRLERVGAGGTFGEMAIVDRSPRSATAYAETDCELLALNRDDFLALLKTNPSFGISLLKALTARLASLPSQYR